MIFGVSRSTWGIGLLCAILLFAGQSYLSGAKKDAIQARDAAILRAEGLGKSIERLRGEVASVQNSQAARVMMWSSADGATPASDVQRAISSEVSQANAILIGLSGIREVTVGTLPSVQLVLEGEADIAQWQDLMKRLSDHRPALLVSDLELRRMNRVSGGEQPMVLFRVTVDAPYIVQEG